MRPEEACSWVMNPSASSTAMSFRMVAEDTPRLWRSTKAFDPTGSCDDT